jgi:rubrerythrin
MKSETIAGSNRTGCAVAPELTEEMIAGTLEFPPTSVGDATGLGELRATYTAEGEPVGTMPPPPTTTQLVKNVANAVTGGAPMQLLDLLGERLAFERAGTRLWDALAAKFDATGGFSGGPTRDQLTHIRDEEHRHFTMLCDLMERLGGDPTAVTPAAEVAAVASMGLPAVLTDPRTEFVQCLEAILVAELVDNDCWPPLLELLSNAGYEDEAKRLLCAVQSEREHLECVRSWLATAQGRSVEAVTALSHAETDSVMATPVMASLATAAP